MADIKPYTERVAAQGQLNVQASPSDFGAQVGAALGTVGSGITSVADAMYQQQVQQETTKVYTDTAEAQVKLMGDLKERIQNAEPGDLTFVSSFKQNIDDTLEKLSSNYTTPAAQREFARMSAAINRDFLSQAIAQQGKLVADGVRVDNAKILSANGSVVFNSPGMLDSVIATRNSQIDNPESIYGQLPKSERERLKMENEQELRKAAMMGQVTQNPELFMAKVSPETLKKFSAADRTVTSLTTSTPNVNGKVAGLAPVITENANKFGVDANILTAQLMQESGGKTGAVSPKGAAGISQFVPGTAARYNVDVNDDNSSIRGQANYMSDLLQMFGGDYAKALAGYNWGEGNVQKAINKLGVNWMSAAPKETRDYVGAIMKNAGVQAATGQPPVYDMEPAKIGDRNFDALPWHDQYQILQTAQQHVSANQVRAQHNIAETERRRKQAESEEMKVMLVKLEAGELTPDMVLQSKVLDASSSMVMLNAIRTKANRLDDTKPEVLNTVIQQVVSGKITDPQEMWGYVGKGLSLTDIQRVQGIINGKGTPDIESKKVFLKAAQAQISGHNPMMGIQDPEGELQYLKFFSEFNEVVAQKQKDGVPVSQMFNASPNNKEYLGWLIDKYKRDPQQRMRAAADMVRGAASSTTSGVTPRMPGETIAQYNARTGGK